jgi:uncharacterized membrane protein YphA (DoxX/SURF4 family)
MAQEKVTNDERQVTSSTSNIKHRTSNILWRLVDLIVGGLFIYAGVIKVLEPIRFGHDIDNYKILPWSVAVRLAFYLPWLEIFCGLAVVLRVFYRGGLSILTALVFVFIAAAIAAKSRGLDITCGCFGHASKNWSFSRHLVVDLALLATLVALWIWSRSGKKVRA